MVNWVEHGQAPLSILAVRIDPQTNVVTESRILCAYPLTAVYDGHGNPNIATSYRCSGNLRRRGGSGGGYTGGHSRR